MAEAEIGMAGVGVMGSNLAFNMERNGFAVAAWDRDPSLMDKLKTAAGADKRITQTLSPEEFVR